MGYNDNAYMTLFVCDSDSGICSRLTAAREAIAHSLLPPPSSDPSQDPTAVESERVKNGEAVAALLNWLQTFKRYGWIGGTIIIIME